MFWEMYGGEIITALIGFAGTAVTAIAGWLAVKVKTWWEAKQKDETVAKVVKTTVQAVEQMYKNCHGQEKLDLALQGASDILASKGIEVSEFELKYLIESAVGEFNNVFNKTVASEDTDPVEETIEE